MAAEVTVATGWPRRNVIGSMNQYLYKVTAASTTDYLTTPLKLIKGFNIQGSASATAPGATIAAVSASDPRQRITLALGATDSALYIQAEGW
jgi:hypothetical protein